MPDLYGNIPAELKLFPRWVVWRLIERDGKRSKQPFNPRTGFLADITNPADCCSFDEASAAVGYDGIGFAFTKNDPFTGIDIDHADDPSMADIIARLFREFPSYTERSPSGNGYHIIVKGSVSRGRRRDGIEVYPNERYFTFTGDVVRSLPIVDCQPNLDILFDEMAPHNEGSAGLQADVAESLSDEALRALILASPDLAALYKIDPETYSGDKSAADQALCNALAARSGNRAQVERAWLASPLGAREKTQTRADYRKRTLERAFDRPKLAPVDLRGVMCGGKPLFAPTPLASGAVIDAADLEAMPASPRLDMWADNIPVGQVTLLDSAGGAGKSLGCQQLATCIALGRPFLGHHTMPGVALYVTCEDDIDELHRRQHDINKAEGVSFAEHRKRLGLVSLVNEIGNELVAFDQNGRMTLGARFQWLVDTIASHNADIVFLDNATHFFLGNEIIRNQVGPFLALLNKTAHDTGTAIVLISHTNKSGGQSGSTAWSNQVRTRLTLEIPQDGKGFISDFNARVLTRAKSNYARTGKAIKFYWNKGAFKLEADMDQSARLELAANYQANFEDETFLRCLDAATEQKRNVSHNKGTNYAPTTFSRMPECSGLDTMAMERAMDRLFHTGQVLADQFVWLDSHRKRKIGLKRAEKPVGPLL